MGPQGNEEEEQGARHSLTGPTWRPLVCLRVQQEYELVKQGKSGGVAMSVEKRRAAIKAMHQARKARHTAVLYYSYSDIALFFLMVAAHYVSPHGRHGGDSLETASKELEQNVLVREPTTVASRGPGRDVLHSP